MQGALCCPAWRGDRWVADELHGVHGHMRGLLISIRGAKLCSAIPAVNQDTLT
jgi:hypothetical protein